MGVCSSCLGRGNPKDAFDEDEESRLLDDPNGIHYNSFGEPGINGQDNNPVEVQRENEALQRVVAKTSDNMVDIFEIAPQHQPARPNPGPFAYAGQEARIVRYQHLLSRLASKHDDLGRGISVQGQGPPGIQVDWFPEEEAVEVQQGKAPSVKSDSDEPLVGTFADAAAAMS
ncbi:hypothetical protein SODALDRAFT_269421 [Sodiomyces alkalinus F11]|uniref:Late endosomal/lysosomal adaptor and MAPK and MTOR activator domain-containing protein n=1 Tax=Sodiomyces alkalinus (strain CBS 110278 / VKM F-3762 / F11) TaxID=1314773 RepID=A0A3N2QAM9_SODAK|nr:hypothetical protein SODALDRAFT_269421 [Sodiomyces alkalinus F11]ROT43811.1 hypothetical protein SODALDRAFT_269421 [Sodiomyces alkalinus F11]